MSKKWFKRIITGLSVGAFALLLLPIFMVSVDGTEYVVRGLNLPEFSVWGCIVLMIPLIILALLYSHMTITQKSVGIIGIQCANLIGVHSSLYGAKEWVEEISSHYASPEPYLFAYAALVTVTLIIFYLYNEYLGNSSFRHLKFLKNRNKENE